MYKIAEFIVDKRNLIFLITIIGIIFSFFSVGWVNVENDLAKFLPEDAESNRGLHIMEDQFITYGTAKVMTANVSMSEAVEIHEKLKKVDGVLQADFDDSTNHYNRVSALYTITFSYPEDDPRCLDALEDVKSCLQGQDIYVSTALGTSIQDTLMKEILLLMGYVSVIVLIILVLTTRTYGEIVVMLIAFVVAAVLNMGTNFFLGTISFASNSVTTILQLALSLDYAVILTNRYREEWERLRQREAVITALSKAIPEISASSLTTIGGLAAMLFMQFKIGPDLGICLIKAILIALLNIFLVMPGLLMLFGPLIEKTQHRSYMPKINFVGEFAYRTRKVVPGFFVVAVIAAMIVSSSCPFSYGYSSVKTPKLNETQIADKMVRETFTSYNAVAVLVPAGDYGSEAALLKELEGFEEVESTMGLANTEALNGYYLADLLNPREFSELANLDYEMAQLVYAAYAAEQGVYEKLISGITNYEVPLIDIFLFAAEQAESGIVSLEGEQNAMLETAGTMMKMAKEQLQGEDYSRLLVNLNLPEGGDETYQFLDRIRSTAQKYYQDGDVCLTGNSVVEYDFQKSFSRDNVIVSVVSILIVMIVLLFTFKSVGMPLLLIMVIQGSIWMNFSVPTLTDEPIFFMSYLVMTAIQMGANIDYAIVIASRFYELKDTMEPRKTIIETMNFAFPTVITSGSIMVISGLLMGKLTSEASIASIGTAMARGTSISIVLVLFVLPQLLLIGSKIVDKTSFSVSVTGAARTLGLISEREEAAFHDEE